ncbi:hypothetical protein ACAG25_11870 [Mycobacterium sp. pV006]|uniref:hypothetical protein n=1 Tax=Mycobacterium sp. pV006 TaxID=3238983 RepID=UPI00351B532C
MPITDEDVRAVAEFLHDHHDGRVPWMRACAGGSWQVRRPNNGFMLRDGERVVGALLALYSERMIDGRAVQICNIGTWCVLPAYRSRSMALLNALLAQEGNHFTVLSPNPGPQEVLSWMGFSHLDTTAALLPNLPWPSLPGRFDVITEPRVVERTLVGSQRQIYRDHVCALAARQLVLAHDGATCHVMYREFRHAVGTGYAMILYVSDPLVFRRCLRALTRHLLLRRGLIATLIEIRILGDRSDVPSWCFRLRDRRKMYRSDSLAEHQIDYLYSELVTVPW